MNNVIVAGIARQLNGRHYGYEIDNVIEAYAKQNQCVIVYGASDDCLEFRGAIYDEVGAYNGTTAYVKNGKAIDKDTLMDALCILEDENAALLDFCGLSTEELTKEAIEVKAVWDGEDDTKPAWAVTCNARLSASFEIFEDGKLWSIGCVFCLKDGPV